MKKILFLLITLVVASAAVAQVDRTKAPTPGAAREIKIGDYQTFTLKNGLQVFVVENHKLPRVQFTIQLKNDPILERDKTGYVEMAGALLVTGTKTRTKAQIDEEVDYIGATLNSSWTGMFASSLTKHTDKLMELMTDVLYNPSFSKDEMEKLKTQTLSGLAANKDDPQAIAGDVRKVLNYGKDHTYGEISTEKTVGNISLDDCNGYYNTYFRPGNAYLVIVGDIDIKTAKTTAEKYFNKWTAGEVKNPTYAKPTQPAKTYVALVDRPASVQSVINITYPIELKTGSQEAIKARVLNQVLGGSFSARLMQNLREKHGYTYGASSQLNSDFLIGNFIATASVRNEVTDSSVQEFMAELKRIASEPITAKELSDAKAFISGAFGRSLENPQTIATFAVNTAKYNLPKDYYNNYLKSIDAVTIADVQASAKLYIKPENAHILVVGKGSEVAEKLKRFGEVKYFDIYGEPYVPAKSSALPAGLTAEKVFAKYIEAIGGLKKVQAVKTSKVVFKANFQGREFTMTDTKKDPNKSKTEIAMGPQVIQQAVSDGKSVSMVTMGQAAPLDDAEKEEALFGNYMFPELFPGVMGSKAELKGIENVDGKENYVIEVTLSKGKKVTSYYDAETGLRTQTTSLQKSPQGEVPVTSKVFDYKEVNGVLIPHTFTLPFGPTSVKFEAHSVEVNVPVDDSTFKVQ